MPSAPNVKDASRLSRLALRQPALCSGVFTLVTHGHFFDVDVKV